MDSIYGTAQDVQLLLDSARGEQDDAFSGYNQMATKPYGAPNCSKAALDTPNPEFALATILTCLLLKWARTLFKSGRDHTKPPHWMDVRQE